MDIMYACHLKTPVWCMYACTSQLGRITTYLVIYAVPKIIVAFLCSCYALGNHCDAFAESMISNTIYTLFIYLENLMLVELLKVNDSQKDTESFGYISVCVFERERDGKSLCAVCLCLYSYHLRLISGNNPKCLHLCNFRIFRNRSSNQIKLSLSEQPTYKTVDFAFWISFIETIVRVLRFCTCSAS